MVAYQWGWRRRWGAGRPMKPRTIGRTPVITNFNPIGPPGQPEQYGKDPVTMTYDEYEVLRLIDYQGLTQEEAAKQMGISRGTVWRCLDKARRKIATMLVEGRKLTITSTGPID